MANVNSKYAEGKIALIKTKLDDPKLSRALLDVLPAHIPPAHMVRIAKTAISNNPLLLDCDMGSLLKAVIQTSILGLEPDTPLGHSYFVPFKGKVKLLVGYRGLVELAHRSGKIDHVSAQAVHENDEIHISMGTENKIEHAPALTGDRGKVRLYYATLLLKGSNIPMIDVMSIADIESVKARSAAARSSHSPWTTDPTEMGRKTVLKRLMKYAPLSPDMERAIKVDTRGDVGGAQPLDLGDVEIEETLPPITTNNNKEGE